MKTWAQLGDKAVNNINVSSMRLSVYFQIDIRINFVICSVCKVTNCVNTKNERRPMSNPDYKMQPAKLLEIAK